LLLPLLLPLVLLLLWVMGAGRRVTRDGMVGVVVRGVVTWPRCRCWC